MRDPRRSTGRSRAVQESHGIVAYLLLPLLQPRSPSRMSRYRSDLLAPDRFQNAGRLRMDIHPVKFKVFSFSGQTFDYYR